MWPTGDLVPTRILHQEGEWEEGEGVRITLLPHHLQFSLRTEGEELVVSLLLIDLLDAMADMTPEITN